MNKSLSPRSRQVPEDCSWDSLATAIVWDNQSKTWDDFGNWYYWGGDPSLSDGWIPDVPAAAVWNPDVPAAPLWSADAPLVTTWTADQPPANVWAPEAPLKPC